MDDLYGTWMPASSYARDFILFLTNSNSYFIIFRDLAVEWGQYESEFIHPVMDLCVVRMRFYKQGYDGTEKNISTLLETDWHFYPRKLGESQLSEITISEMSISKLIRCQSIEFF